MDILSTISAVEGALKIGRQLKDIQRGVDEAEFKLEISDLMTHLADAKIGLADAKQALDEKERELNELRARFKKQSEIVEHHGYFFWQDGEGKPQGHPLCTMCLQKEGLQIMTTPSKGFVEFSCPNCKATYHQPPDFLWSDEVR